MVYLNGTGVQGRLLFINALWLKVILVGVYIPNVCLACGLSPLCRGVHLELRRQHAHEGGDAVSDAHRGGGCVAALHVAAGLRPAYGHHLPRLRRHPPPRAGRQPRQAHGQLRYRMTQPPVSLQNAVLPSLSPFLFRLLSSLFHNTNLMCIHI